MDLMLDNGGPSHVAVSADPEVADPEAADPEVADPEMSDAVPAMSDAVPAMSDAVSADINGRMLLQNLDGNSCFMTSLCVALFLPETYGYVDAKLFAGGGRTSDVLRQIACVVRGTARFINNYAQRGIRSALCFSSGMAQFRVGQQDPNEFLLMLMTECGGGDALTPCFFETRMEVVNTYENKKPEVDFSVEKQRCESLGALTAPRTDLSKVFPRIRDTFEPGPDGLLVPQAGGLLQQRTLTHFVSGDVVIFTCERAPAAGGAEIMYGERDASTRAYEILIQTTSASCARFQLCSVIVWRGLMGGSSCYDGAMGHYTAYAYHAPSRQWVWFDDARGGKAEIMPVTETPETWPPSPRFGYGKTRDTNQHAAFDFLNSRMIVFDSPEALTDLDNHKKQHGSESFSKWRPSVHGVFFLYVRV